MSAPLDFSTTSSSSSSEDQQPVNLSERLQTAGSPPPSSYPADPNRKYPVKAEYNNNNNKVGTQSMVVVVRTDLLFSGWLLTASLCYDGSIQRLLDVLDMDDSLDIHLYFK